MREVDICKKPECVRAGELSGNPPGLGQHLCMTWTMPPEPEVCKELSFHPICKTHLS
ncbi:hypothetical protein L228DRAFT_251446 [Xylona heveae TC161]|uniref:Uncharacterized protein n=1 Tax=Xylona heveae (strain CBS 132557 / TC161) TaxID=1328760 RepID=A0A164ZC62_XYLHT|nr:hypothetical protein L228DRAFT_251446 [Xylona heveae TC161]KZF18921.1 hypothetical protein L228DRAFT_251446 [Xylona heveae TC161]